MSVTDHVAIHNLLLWVATLSCLFLHLRIAETFELQAG